MSNEIQATEQPNIRLEDDLWKQFRIPIISTVIVLAAVIAIAGTIYANHTKMESEAAAVYLSGTTPDVWKSVVARYPKSYKAVDALLNLASDAVEKKNYEEALSYYKQIVSSFHSHPAAPAAELAIATCYESLGKKDEAIKEYSRIIKSKPNHTFVGGASLGIARVYQSLGKISEAKTALSDYISKAPQSTTAEEARLELNKLNATTSK